MSIVVATYLILVTLIFSTKGEKIDCIANQDCIINCTSSSISCDSKTINGSLATSLTVNCFGENICQYSTILCPYNVLNNTSFCNINCNGISSCQDSIINSNGSSILHLDCYTDSSGFACRDSIIYGPLLSADINCDSFNSNCVGATFYMDNTQNVSVNCPKTSCQNVNFYVNNSNYADFWFWSQSSFENHIYGSNIKQKLSITCTGTFGCGTSTIQCPDNAKCEINFPDYVFENAIYSKFNIHIPDALYTYLDIKCGDGISQCIIESPPYLQCGSNYQSAIDFDINDNSKINKWYCFQGQYNNGWNQNCCPPDFVRTFSKIICNENEDCIISNKSQSIINGSLSNSLTVYCNDTYSCQGTQIICPQNKMCNIYCHKERSCRYVRIDGNNLNNFHVECGYDHACERMTVNVSINGNLSILCDNLYGCGYSYFGIESTSISTINSSVDIKTGVPGIGYNGLGSAYGVIFDVRNINNALIDCSGGCSGGKVYAPTVNKLDLLCVGTSACRYMDIYCPSHSVHACNMLCGSDSGSCYGAGIYVDRPYKSDYIDIKCSVSSVCSQMQAYCNGDEDEYSNLYYDSNNNNSFYCPPFNQNLCCPWLPPSLSPTTYPTSQSTQPTMIPTTAQPTNIPTTAIPTISPTTIPTNMPTTTMPTTSLPTTALPTTAIPTSSPVTHDPTTANPTTANPTTANPTTSFPSTSLPTSSLPTTSLPTNNPTDDPIIMTTATKHGQTTSTTVSQDDIYDGKTSDISDSWLLIIIICVVVLILIILLCIGYRKLKGGDKKQYKQKMQMSALQTSTELNNAQNIIPSAPVSTTGNEETNKINVNHVETHKEIENSGDGEGVTYM